jgi:ribosomal protein S2
MLYHYYYKRLHLFKIPYLTLLAYHSPLGNSIKFWTSHNMNSFILAVRNEIYILNIAYTMIQIRRALNTIFHKVRYRGTLTIYAQALKALKLNQESVFSFVTTWIPGLLTNYKLVTTAIQAYKIHLATSIFFLKRPQLKAINQINLNSLPLASTIRNRYKIPHIPKFPSISLSILDCPIWLNECECLGIPSIQLCDTQSPFQKVTYPIISNQRSVVFTNLIVHLAAEVCNTSLISSHLEFLSFYQYHNQKIFAANLQKKRVYSFDVKHLVTYSHVKRGLRRNRKKRWFSRHMLSYLYSYEISYEHELRGIMRMKRHSKRITQHYSQIKKPLIINKHTYIFNKRFFTYQVKDLINNKITPLNFVSKQYYSLIHHKIWAFIVHIKAVYNRLSLLFKWLYRRKFYRYYWRLNKTLRKLYHQVIVMLLGLRRALSRKRREKRKYITMVSLKKRDISSLILCSFLITPKAFNLLKNNELNYTRLRVKKPKFFRKKRMKFKYI